jgi:hypothetical protein
VRNSCLLLGFLLSVLVIAGCGSGGGSKSGGSSGSNVDTTGWKVIDTSTTQGGDYIANAAYAVDIRHPKAIALQIDAKPNITSKATTTVQCDNDPTTTTSVPFTSPSTTLLKLPKGPLSGCTISGIVQFQANSAVTVSLLSK